MDLSGPVTSASTLASRYGRPRAPVRGLPGFAGSGEFDLAVGTVTGYRWWVVPLPCSFDELVVLKGATGRYRWRPGLNEAVCNYDSKHWPPVEYDLRDGRECGCGFWAYWDHTASTLGVAGIGVVGAMSGSGRTLVGDRGFRSQQGRITALHVPLDGIYTPLAAAFGRARLTAAGVRTFRAITGRDPVTAEEEEKALAAAQVILGQVETGLQEAYPDAEICATLPYLLVKHPPEGRP